MPLRIGSARTVLHVRDITHDENDAAIVKPIISMAHSLKMTVIAADMETDGQFAYMEANHCDEIQGNFFSRPVPAGVFEKMLDTTSAIH